MAGTKKKTGIPWEYCECGCKGSEVRIGSLYYWMFDDLCGTFYLNAEHAGDVRTEIDHFSSRAALNATVRKHAVGMLRSLRDRVRQTARAVHRL